MIADNNAAIKTVVNGGIDNSNIASDAAIQASKIDASYTAYMPAWTSDGSPPSLGNATVKAAYAQIGDLVHVFCQIDFGSTTTFGSGHYTFSLPVNMSTNVVLVGQSVLNRNSAGTGYTAAAAIETSSTTFQIFYPATYLGAATAIGAAAPWTWAENDIIQWNFTYQSA